MPRFDDFVKVLSQLVDDVLNSAMDVETKISEAAESFERAINETRVLKDSSPSPPVANRNSVGAVINEIARASTNDISGVLVADAPKGNSYPKVGIYHCRPLLANRLRKWETDGQNQREKYIFSSLGRSLTRTPSP